MEDFFSNEVGQTIEWFGLTHILLMVGLILSMVLFSWLSPKFKKTPYEKWIRFFILFIAIIVEWRVFESRIFNGSIFRLPLCAVALYTLTYAVVFKNKTVFNICYFYSFGAILTYLFFDTPFGLDRFSGWTFFIAHAVIMWWVVYGIKVLDYLPTKQDLYKAMGLLAIYAGISGYATYRFGGSDELFIHHPAVGFLQGLIDIHPLFYLAIWSLFVAVVLVSMYVPIYLINRKEKK